MSLRPKTFAEALARKQRADERRRQRMKDRPAEKKERKSTGQAEAFAKVAQRDLVKPLAVWKCFTCEKPMDRLRHYNFSHLLPKGSYKRYMTLPENIVIQCYGCHQKWHNAGRIALVRGDHGHEHNWKQMFDQYDQLEQRYNRGQ